MATKTRALLLATIMLVSLVHAQALEINARAADPPVCNAERGANWTVGTIQCNDNISEGYTLFSPMPTSTSYLIDNEGRLVHNWTSPGGHRPGMSAYLLDDGSLLRTANIAQTAVGNFSGGGTGGKVERILPLRPMRPVAATAYGPTRSSRYSPMEQRVETSFGVGMLGIIWCKITTR